MVAQPVNETDQGREIDTLLTVREQRVLLSDVSWELLESILADNPDRNIPRVAYDEGALEFMTPSELHEEINWTLALVVIHLTDSWRLDRVDTGALTLRRPGSRRASEPDSSFYIQHAKIVGFGRNALQPGMPPPDLAIEIEISRSLVPRLPIFAAMGVPEIWQATDSQVTILSLEAGEYREVAASSALPLLSSQKLNEFLRLSHDVTRLEWSEALREWAAEVADER